MRPAKIVTASLPIDYKSRECVSSQPKASIVDVRLSPTRLEREFDLHSTFPSGKTWKDLLQTRDMQLRPSDGPAVRRARKSGKLEGDKESLSQLLFPRPTINFLDLQNDCRVRGVVARARFSAFHAVPSAESHSRQ
jgi:hypothetical protein